MASLLAGRNQAPLSRGEIDRATATFLAFDDKVSARYEAGARTRFVVVPEQDGEPEYGEVVFSEDLYPGNNIAHANAALSMRAAAAHELSHFYRWLDKRELDGAAKRNLDEALTSLEAAQRFAKKLTETEILELVADAAERLRLHLADLA